jgi:hypothetical protein
MPAYDDLPVIVAPQMSAEPVPAGPVGDDALEERLPTVHGVVEEAEVEEAEVEAGEVEEAEVEEAEVEEAEVEAPAEPPTAAAGPAPSTDEEAIGEAEFPHEDVEPSRTEPEQPRAEATPAAAGGNAVVADAETMWESKDEAPRVRPVRTEPGHLPERRVVVIDEDADIANGPSTRPAVAPTDESLGATLHDEAPKRRWRLFRKGGA